MEKKNHLNIAVNASGAALNICILCTHFTLYVNMFVIHLVFVCCMKQSIYISQIW